MPHGPKPVVVERVLQQARDAWNSKREECLLRDRCVIPKKGYAILWLREGEPVLAHRHVYAQVIGPIPDGMNVLHSCDRPACFNPCHFFIGTHLDNVKDKMAKGRQARGERNGGGGKLTTADVLVIRGLQVSGLTRTQMAAKFSVSKSTVDRIVHRHIWSHVP